MSELTGAAALTALRTQMQQQGATEHLQVCEQQSANIVGAYKTSGSGKLFLAFLAFYIIAESEKESW